jgi:hypothetical protein
LVGTNGFATTAGSDGTNAWSANGATDIADDRWHFVVATYDGTAHILYVDGLYEGHTMLQAIGGGLNQIAKPFNIGGQGGNAGTASINPLFGRVDEAFVTSDILTPDQVRMLYAAKVPHGYSTTPTRAHLLVRRKRRGEDWVNADFPSQPARYYDGGTLTDKGTNAKNLTANAAPTLAAGPDGTASGAYYFIRASSQYLSADDTGMPTGNMTWGAWFKSFDTSGAVIPILGYGTTVTTNERLIYFNATVLHMFDVAADVTGVGQWADGFWHLVVAQYDTGAVDGLKMKLYADGRLIGSSTTTPAAVGLVGANGFRVGRRCGAGVDYMSGQIGSSFITSTILTQEQIAVLYQKSSQALVGSPKDESQHIEAFDATNVYWVGDAIDSNWAVDLSVAA